MQDSVKELLGRRRNRAIAIILTTKEQECDKHLPDDASFRLRKSVLDQLNEFHDLCIDLIDSLSTSAVMNDIWLARLEEIYDYISYEPPAED